MLHKQVPHTGLHPEHTGKRRRFPSDLRQSGYSYGWGLEAPLTPSIVDIIERFFWVGPGSQQHAD